MTFSTDGARSSCRRPRATGSHRPAVLPSARPVRLPGRPVVPTIRQSSTTRHTLPATTTVLSSSHVVMLSQPNKVAKVIEEAVAGELSVGTRLAFAR